ncbi:MAG: single-stranded DNA-binding protein [Verrucomicrobia bacterium]|nr:single-stranded DNA-binding protein [Verrucomicrobiota bacterium]
MASFNKVILMGNLTRDPELRYTPKGTAIARIGLAVNRSWKTDTGESREETTFVDIDAWSQQAETIAKHLRKGSALLVEGRLRLDQWDDKQTGQKRSKLVVVCENFRFVGPAPARDDAAAEPPRERPPAAAAAPPTPAESAPESPADDDVPF